MDISKCNPHIEDLILPHAVFLFLFCCFVVFVLLLLVALNSCNQAVSLLSVLLDIKSIAKIVHIIQNRARCKALSLPSIKSKPDDGEDNGR